MEMLCRESVEWWRPSDVLPKQFELAIIKATPSGDVREGCYYGGGLWSFGSTQIETDAVFAWAYVPMCKTIMCSEGV